MNHQLGIEAFDGLGDDIVEQSMRLMYGGSVPPVGANGEPESVIPRQLSHDSLALELGQHGWDQDAKFVAAWGQWLFWNDGRWVQEEYVISRSRIRDFLRSKADEIAKAAQATALELDAAKAGAVQRAAAKIGRELGAQQTVTAVEAMARTNAASIAAPTNFDANPMLLGTPGGTVDLRTGKLRSAGRADMLTKFTAVTPAANGSAPIWTDFLRRVFPGADGGGDAEMIAFVQRAAGYALTGETSEQKLFFLHGTGRNGKGTIIQTLTAIFADYAKAVSSSIFMQQHGESHPTGLAQLNGPRLVASNEIPKGATWNEETIKSLTGGDTISARKMRQDFFEFRPQLTLVISGNNLPRFKGVGLSMRERFILVPFTQNFTDENGKRDPHLGDKLKAEWPQILRWCIEGALEWQRIGLSPPASVQKASVEYLDEEDDIAQFVAEYLEADPTAKTATSDIYPAFKEFQHSRGVQHIWTMPTMTRALGEEGNLKIDKARPTSGLAKPGSRCVIGYALKRRPSQNWSADEYGTL